jgi:hypothetical protein
MCDILAERIRIIQILETKLSNYSHLHSASIAELTEIGLEALHHNYEGDCPDECLRDAARIFAVTSVWRHNQNVDDFREAA